MSTNYSPESYLPTIDAILGVADLEQITVKKIRNALQELFGVDLSSHKKEINDIILGRYYEMIDKRTEQEKSEKERRAEIERQDAIMAAQLSKSEVNGPLVRARRVYKSPAVANRKPGGFNKEMDLSPELQEFLKARKMSRPQVVKKLWAYIKKADLQNPNDKRQIYCDEALQKIFKKKTVGAFEMNKILTKHIFKPEDINGSEKVKKEVSDDDDDSNEYDESSDY